MPRDLRRTVLFLFMSLLAVTVFLFKPNFNSAPPVLYYHPLDNMPVLEGPSYGYGAPKEDRGIEYRRFLAVSLQVRVRGSSGSGTIIHYDPIKNEAFVASCGHLWGGNMSASEGRNRNMKARVVTWYHNETKLSEPKTYDADVICYSNSSGYDISLLKFKPDWEPEYFPIAPANYKMEIGDKFHATGCDGAKEVARYEIEFIRIGRSAGYDTRSTLNSARPGRSGGGVLTDDGYFIAITWGTTDTVSGRGESIHTSLSSIRAYYERHGYGFLNSQPLPSWLRNIQIIDRNNPYQKFHSDYIPMPRRAA